MRAVHKKTSLLLCCNTYKKLYYCPFSCKARDEFKRILSHVPVFYPADPVATGHACLYIFGRSSWPEQLKDNP